MSSNLRTHAANLRMRVPALRDLGTVVYAAAIGPLAQYLIPKLSVPSPPVPPKESACCWA